MGKDCMRFPSAAAGCLLALVLLSQSAYSGWTQRLSWNRLRKNMSSQNVQNILGAPKDTEESNVRVVWYYQQTPVRQDGRVISRPKQGYVYFSKSKTNPVTRQQLNEPGLFVTNWAEPDWQAITDEDIKADTPSLDDTEMMLPPDMEQRRQEIIKQHQEQMRLMEEERKMTDAEFERRHQETLEQIQKHRQQMQRRMQDVNIPATRTPQPTFTPPVKPMPDMPQLSGQSAQPQSSEAQRQRKIVSLVGFLVGIVLAIGVLIAIFPALMKVLVRLLAGLQVTWWTCCKAYIVAHILGVIVVKGSDRIMKHVQLNAAGLLLLSIVSIVAAFLIYANVYRIIIRDEKNNHLSLLKAVLLTLIIDALPLLILFLVF